MRILILGSGVIGVTSAWYLAKAGHEVTVIDRASGAAQETSFANAGQISPGYSAPWAAPGVPFKAMKWMFERHAPLVLHWTADKDRLRWLLEMLANCTSKAYARNKSRMVRLAEYSRDCMDDLRAETGLSYDNREQGTLQVFRTQKQVDAAAKDIEVLRKDGVPFEVLDRTGCVAAEPGLAGSAHRIAGGLRLPGDGTGDCFKFTNVLQEKAAAAGVTFKYGVTIHSVLSNGDRITGVTTSEGLMEADAYVVALGSYSPQLVKHLGIRLPIQPLKGYSITAPIVDEAKAPVSTVMDETFKVAITRLGDRIRVGGLAEIAGYDLSLHQRRRETLEKSLTEMFGGAGDLTQASFWTGLRPMTPDGTPIVGQTPYRNLWTNTGHGTLGWTMAAGSGRLLSDLMSGVQPQIDPSGLAVSRYGRTVPDARVAAPLRPAAA